MNIFIPEFKPQNEVESMSAKFDQNLINYVWADQICQAFKLAAWSPRSYKKFGVAWLCDAENKGTRMAKECHMTFSAYGICLIWHGILK